jgi:subtilase family serine protease
MAKPLIAFTALLAFLFLLPGPLAAGSQGLELTLEASPRTPDPGQRVEIRIGLKNTSASAVSPGSINVLAGGKLIDKVETPGLEPGAGFIHRLAWTAGPGGRVRIEARLEGLPVAETWVRVREGSAGSGGGIDVALAWLASPPTGCLGQGPWTAQVGLANRGKRTSRPGTLLFLVNGKTADQAPIPALAPGQQLLLSFTWRGARVGPNRLTAELDQKASRGDTDPANNRITQEFVFRKCQPDLTPVSLKLEGRPEPGRRPLRAKAVIANQGGVAAESFRVNFLVDGEEIGGFDLGRLGPGRRRAVKIDWMPPRPGTYTLAVEVEAAPGEGEVETANNRRETTFSTLDDMADLALVRPDLPLNLCFGKDPIKIRTEILNRGRKESGRTELVLRKGTKVLADKTLEPLPPGGSMFVDLEWAPPEIGSYRLFLVLDPGDLIEESNENNNSTLVQVRFRDCRPDLIVSSVRVGDVLGPDEDSRRLVFSVHNRGGRISEPTLAAVLIDEQKVAELEVKPVQPAASNQYETTLPRLRTGRHELRIVIDPKDAIEEVSKANNDYQRQLESRPGEVDLTLSGLSLEPAAPLAGKPLLIKVRTVNNGSGVARVEVAFRVDGREIGRKFLSGLWTRSSKEVVLELAQAPEEGSSLEAVVDPDNLIVETDESNNSLKISLFR